MLSMDEGTSLVRIARENIKSHLEGKNYNPPQVPDVFKRKSGVFVTLNTYPQKNLRGCIGLPEPVHPLIDAVLEASIAAATQDPRFYPVSFSEFEKIVVEVTVLTPPKLIKAKSYKQLLDEIEIGRDGLIVEKRFYKGLLLPQVPLEWEWDKEEFLSQTCVKAGLPPDEWIKDDELSVYKFSGQIFSEIAPDGEIVKL
ncbi:MAG: TIGR00296 family protein [Candidatus Methanofastidiosia archaeon]